MQLSNSGRVVIVDDSWAEVQPLVEMLGLRCIPYVYYDGSAANLPIDAPGGVRFVFLDIKLQGMEGQDEKTKASGLTARLKKIISEKNGPYVIIFWTKHREIIELVIRNCHTESITPVAWLDLEKNDCIRGDGSYNIEIITESLKQKLVSIGAFQLYVEWENILNDSGKQFISEISSLVGHGDSWSKETASLFYSLYKAYVDKNEINAPLEQFKYACHLMNKSFIDALENKTASDLKIPTGFKLVAGEVSDDIKAKLYTSLFIGKYLLCRPTTGSVFLETEAGILDGLRTIYKEDQYPRDAKLCKIIITPACDLAQNKTIRLKIGENNDAHLHRIVCGLFYPVADTFKVEKNKFREKGQDALYFIGPFWHENKRCILAIHFATLSTEVECSFTGNALFVLKRDLLFDLQSKVANHVNRLGKLDL